MPCRILLRFRLFKRLQDSIPDRDRVGQTLQPRRMRANSL